MKKFLNYIIILCMLLTMGGTNVYAYNKKPQNKGNKVDEARKQVNKPFNVSARCAIALDCNTKRIMYEKNSHMIVPMASTTKILTALIAIKHGDLDREVEISANASAIRGSTVGYRKGEKIKMKELLYGLMFKSGNDAAIAIAESIGGSIEGFAAIMNEYAKEIGILDSSFVTPHGLDYEKHYSTAYDLAILTSKAKEEKLFNEISSSKVVDGKAMGFTRSYNNINKILWQISNANGVKTGYTGQAGKCLVTSINHKEKTDIVIVVLNCTERWKETSRIYEFVKNNYEYKTVLEKGKEIGEYKINKGNGIKSIALKESIEVPIKKGSNITHNINMKSYSNEDLEEGQIIGDIEIFEENMPIYKKFMILDEPLNKVSTFTTK